MKTANDICFFVLVGDTSW